MAYNGHYREFWREYVEKNKHPMPDIVISLHPGLHDDFMVEHWEPTLHLLLNNNIPTVLTSCNLQEHEKSIRNLNKFQPEIILSGLNPFGSTHWKQMPLELDRIWAANAYRLVMKGKKKDRKSASAPTPFFGRLMDAVHR